MRGRVLSKAGAELAVKPREFDLLFFLVSRAGLAVSREELVRNVWGASVSVQSRTVDVHIRWLRSRIEDDPGRPVRLLTVRGVGYMFVR